MWATTKKSENNDGHIEENSLTSCEISVLAESEMRSVPHVKVH